MNAPPKQSKFRTFRERKKAAGLREVRMWVPDLRSPEVQAKLARQIAAINASEADREALEWSEANAAESWRALD